MDGVLEVAAEYTLGCYAVFPRHRANAVKLILHLLAGWWVLDDTIDKSGIDLRPETVMRARKVFDAAWISDSSAKNLAVEAGHMMEVFHTMLVELLHILRAECGLNQADLDRLEPFYRAHVDVRERILRPFSTLAEFIECRTLDGGIPTMLTSAMLAHHPRNPKMHHVLDQHDEALTLVSRYIALHNDVFDYQRDLKESVPNSVKIMAETEAISLHQAIVKSVDNLRRLRADLLSHFDVHQAAARENTSELTYLADEFYRIAEAAFDGNIFVHKTSRRYAEGVPLTEALALGEDKLKAFIVEHGLEVTHRMAI